MRLYCMYDTVSEESGMIFEARNDAVARRIYLTMDETALPPGSEKKDFKLYKLGSYDHGSFQKPPSIQALSVPYDITNAQSVGEFYSPDAEDPADQKEAS